MLRTCLHTVPLSPTVHLNSKGTSSSFCPREGAVRTMLEGATGTQTGHDKPLLKFESNVS